MTTRSENRIRHCGALAAALLGLLALAAAPAAAQDQVGIFWDPNATEITGTTPTIPGQITGRVVLHDPSERGGIAGWEACIGLEGPGTFLSWDLGSEAINAGSGECFSVGYTTPLPPGLGGVLATFELYALDPGPIMLSMTAPWDASLPGQMSYIPGDNPWTLVPMTTATGRDEVAGLNGANPLVHLSREEIEFAADALGDTITAVLTITNDSTEYFPIDVSIPAACTSFWVISGGGPGSVSPWNSKQITVGYVAEVERSVFCDLDLGPNLGSVRLTGFVGAPTVTWDLSGDTSIGPVIVGDVATGTLTLTNTGTAVLPVDVSLDSYWTDMTLLAGSGPHDVAPGAALDIEIRFAPTAAGWQYADIGFGASPVPDQRVWGQAEAEVVAWDAPTAADFGQLDNGTSQLVPIQVTNTGNRPFMLDPVLAAGCPEFTLVQGGFAAELLPGFSRSLGVRFTSGVTGSFACQLDLGPTVPAIALTAASAPGPGTVARAPAQLAFGDVWLDEVPELDLVLTNLSAESVALDIALAVAPGPFSVLSGGGPAVLGPGATRDVRVRLLPQFPGSFTASLELGAPFGSVPLSAAILDTTPRCDVQPAYLAFGGLVRGDSLVLDYTVTNVGDVTVDYVPAVSGAGYRVVEQAATLQTGQAAVFQVVFAPQDFGAFTALVTAPGSGAPALPLTGIGLVDPSWVVFSADTLDFGLVQVDTLARADVELTNTGPWDLPLDPQIAPLGPLFTLAAGAGAGSLAPGASHVVTVDFTPTRDGLEAAELSFGPGQPRVQLRGEGSYVAADCVVAPAALNFGEVPVGTTASLDMTVTNTTAGELVLDPVSTDAAFQVASGTIVVPAGQAVTIPVVFAPAEIAAYAAEIDLGNGLCQPQPCYGQGVFQGAAGNDLVGIYWDPGYSQSETILSIEAGIVTGYLVLSSPGLPGGVLGWECRVTKTGPAIVTGWTLQGDAVNLGAGDELIVGLASPLPDGQDILLATVVVVLLTDGDDTVFSLGPTFTPSLPGQMAWVPAAQPELLIPMATWTGTPEVAVIHPGVPTGVGLPAAVTALLPNVPNPFNPATEVRFSLARAMPVRVDVHDLTGRLVARLHEGELPAGPHAVPWDGRDGAGRTVASGAYYVRLDTPEGADTRKIMLLK